MKKIYDIQNLFLLKCFSVLKNIFDTEYYFLGIGFEHYFWLSDIIPGNVRVYVTLFLKVLHVNV